ncbi:MAG: hypothetical protein II621_00545, partial [Clostridia bacterium]|nr:hypothetical protein [Clostridia bacterium]
TGTVWKVEVDGYHSGWMQTAQAFYNFVQVYCNNDSKTYSQAVDQAIAYMQSNNGLSATSNPSLTDVTNFLSYFKFNGTTAPVTLNIGTGYDILAWAPNINAIETGRTYYTSAVHFDTSGGNINPAGCTWDQTTVMDPEANDQLTVADIKQALQDCVRNDAFKTWFNLDFDNMEVDEIMALVQGETSCANTLAAFSLVANLSGSASDAELWDAYVAPQVGKTWEETNDWVQNGLMGAIYKAYAADYTEQLNTIMAEDTSAYTGAQKRDYYNRFVQICLNLENQQDYQFNNIFELILPHMADGFYNKADGLGSIHSDLWVSNASTVGAALATAKKNVAKQFASEYADAFMELVDREVPSYDRSSETQAAAWLNNASTGNAWDGVDDSQYHEGDYLDTNGNGIPDKQDAEAFVTAATAMIANVDGDILPYGTFNDISTSFGTVPNPNHNNSLNTITEDGYNTLLAKIKSAQISANGASAFLGKAQTDAFMKSTILKGQTQENLQNIYTDYYALYATIKATKDAGGELYALVFGNGWKTDGTDEENNAFNTASLAAADEAFQAYSDYDHLIKTTAIDRLYTKLDTIVNKYYGSSGARYYTFEAIIEAYGNLEITPANLFNWLYGTGVRYEAQAGEHTQSELQTLYNSATSAYNSANTFKTNLRQLITARGSGAGADIEIQKYLFGVGGIAQQTYGWRSSVNAIQVANITAAVNSVGLKNYSNASDATIRTLLNNAVTDLDAILVSDDVGSILDELVTVDVKDDQGNIVYEADGVTPKKQGMLGKWKQAYTFLDTSTGQNKTVAVGDDIKNLREFLINLIVDMLYNGKLLNTLFELIYPAIGGMITDGVWTNAEPIDISVAYIYMQGLSGILRRGLPVSPHLFGTRDVGDGDVKWSYFYDGNHLPYNYSNVITAMNTATRFSDKAACWSAGALGKHNQDVSFWSKTGRTAEQTSRSGLWSGGTMVDPFTVNQSDVVDWTAMETNPQ